MHQRPLHLYVIAVAVIWTIILGLMSYLGHTAALHIFSLVALGFVLGILALYIAVHLYTWNNPCHG